MPIKKCECCDAEFMARLTKIRTCSTTCRNRLISKEKGQRHIKSKSCVVCDARFEVGGSEWDRQTCSTSCQYKLTASKTTRSEERDCATCGKKFSAKRSQIESCAGGGSYCSKACMYKRNASETARPCEQCGELFSQPPSHAYVKTCSLECGYKLYSGAARKGYKGLTEMVLVNGVKLHRRTRFGSLVHNTGRRLAEKRATPSWADLDKIKAICDAAAELQAVTGVKYHVDHIVPLRGKTVCGLHCEANLQVLPALDNLVKGCVKWPDMWIN